MISFHFFLGKNLQNFNKVQWTKKIVRPKVQKLSHIFEFILLVIFF